jgi:hypothetical protein
MSASVTKPERVGPTLGARAAETPAFAGEALTMSTERMDPLTEVRGLLAAASTTEEHAARVVYTAAARTKLAGLRAELASLELLLAAREKELAVLRQAARESRAWAVVVRASAGVHDAHSHSLAGAGKRVARVLARVARENAAHAEKMAEIYDKEADACP